MLLDFVSMMRADVRRDGMVRPDLVQALQGLAPPFIRWPGGSFASIYKWKDGIGPQVSRRYHPNTIWGGYSDYYGFGTEEFLGLCRKLHAEPLIVLAATTTEPGQVQYAMDWVHYLNDPPTTEWGRLRASHGHREPYGVRHFQIDNEPMNHGLTPEKYAEIVNVYGSRLRDIAPKARIVACGQKRSNDMVWSQKVIDLAGKNFDVLGVHNYEYEPENFETGLRRIRDYLWKLRDYVRASAHPHIEIGVLEWNLARTYDWRAGLHAAGALMLYEELSPGLTMSCPALLLRNTTDDPTWTSLIYHDHVSWFPGAAYVVEKLFREHYAERYLASTSGAFRDVPDRKRLFDQIATMRPEDWTPGTIDAIATGSADGRRIVIKAVNYGAERNTLLVRLQGAGVPGKAVVRLHTVRAGLTDSASLEHPDAISAGERNAGLRQGPHGGHGVVCGLRGRDHGGMISLSSGRGNVWKGFRGLGCDRLFTDPETDWRIGRKREHDIRRVVGKGAAVPPGEAEDRGRADIVREDVGTEPARDFLSIGAWVFRGAHGGHHTGNGFGDGASMSGEVIGRMAGIEPVAEPFVKLGEQRVDHRKTHTVDRAPTPGVCGESRDGPYANAAVPVRGGE